MRNRILIIDDDQDVRNILQSFLSGAGYTVLEAEDGESGLEMAVLEQPDLILLDINMPGMDGIQVCRKLRSDPKNIFAIIMITASDENEVEGLESGADDYVVKPFSPKVLLSRVKAVLRRKHSPAPDDQQVIQIDDLVIHPGRHEALVENKKLDLTFTEFRILQTLAARPGWVFTRGQIVDAVRGEDHAVTDRSVDFQIVGLRRKLDRYSTCIETVRGVGYRFQEA